ncbi:hypothetical protein Q5424_04865 [Conexibacter sp. JD483]|uniref:hypothetical protein n=1 Tax=unclassified Conexibacter TaxID=2627773 RepID=UPI00271F8B0F|nr:MULTISPECIES: hypothetical protein [unclassified Conexibacter]MDO8184664.1 hypothetical protein [Conexibacter sp. CPCC 205706]MDO8197970.1 hypothetical protein [Conexibacter sp. CPCC 205762]MDR9368400.1 hypothetical protein [Conexibacter sp. JD483]
MSTLEEPGRVLRVPFAAELLPIVLVAVMGEYDDATTPPELPWADHDDIDPDVLDGLRVRHEQIVALGGVIARLTWANPPTTTEAASPHLDAPAALLERVFARAIRDTVLLLSNTADDSHDLLDTDRLHALTDTIKALALKVEEIRSAASAPLDAEPVTIRNPFAGGAGEGGTP